MSTTAYFTVRIFVITLLITVMLKHLWLKIMIKVHTLLLKNFNNKNVLYNLVFILTNDITFAKPVSYVIVCFTATQVA